MSDENQCDQLIFIYKAFCTKVNFFRFNLYSEKAPRVKTTIIDRTKDTLWKDK